MATQALTSRREREAVEISGRIGLTARGVTYFVVGVLALLIATGHEASAPSRRGALTAVVTQPFGRVLTALLAGGFLAFALWRAGEAITGDGWVGRVANVGRGALYAGFFVTAVSFVLHGEREGQKGSTEIDVTARVLEWPGGRFLIIAAGLAVIAGGLWNGYKSLAQRYRKKLKWREMSDAAERIVPTIATVGLFGRMAAFLLVGSFITKAGWQHKPEDAGGLDVALFRVLDERSGPIFVACVAIGLFAFALYSFVEARYREIPQA